MLPSVDKHQWHAFSLYESPRNASGLFFCGGRNKLLKCLVKESKDLGIALHEEAFDW